MMHALPDEVALTQQHTVMIHTIDFAELEPAAQHHFSYSLLQQVNMALIQTQHESLLETLEEHREAGIEALSENAPPPWAGKEQWMICYRLSTEGLSIGSEVFEGAQILGWATTLPVILRKIWADMMDCYRAGKSAGEAFSEILDRVSSRPTAGWMKWSRLQELLPEAGYALFVLKLRDTVMDALLSVRNLHPGPPDELRWNLLQQLIENMDVATGLTYPDGVLGIAYRALLWMPCGEDGMKYTTDEWEEAEEIEIFFEEPFASALGRNLLDDALRMMLSCGIDPRLAQRDNSVCHLSYYIPCA